MSSLFPNLNKEDVKPSTQETIKPSAMDHQPFTGDANAQVPVRSMTPAGQVDPFAEELKAMGEGGGDEAVPPPGRGYDDQEAVFISEEE